ncbi:MAG: VOC family protein [Acidobacteria bacterium]|nr:VOC family protein [Acidobacteriota bacterium]
MKVHVYLMFNGNCEAAFKYYQTCLGGTLNIRAYKDGPPAEHLPADWSEKVMHAQLEFGDQILMASDCPPAYAEPNQGFFVQLALADPAEAERIFNTLAENGTIKMPFSQTFWAYRFGMLVDQFGIPWMINCTNAA